ncbi:VCBS domain-containing protein [Vibrio panuliri]|nr:VCBS domain-containing protein [Vibrio panuliri]KAB1457060.1 tandem-95 repeat protein [Vibrio panuliri]
MATSDKKEQHSVTQTKSNLAQTKNKASKTKIRLFSQVNINVPLPREIAIILPSFAKQLESDPTILKQESDTSSLQADNQNGESLSSEHKTFSPVSKIANQETQLKDEKGEISDSIETSVSLTPHSSHHLSTHYLSTKLHPIVHTISTHSSLSAVTSTPSIQPNVSHTTPNTTAGPSSHTPPTFVDETIQGKYGTLHVGANGQYTFTLDPKSPAYVLLQKQELGTDTFTLHLSDGTKVVVQIPVHGTQDNPTISGDLTGSVTEDHNVDSQGFITTGGKIDVVDPDHDESSVHAETLNGKFGSLTIDANGHWQYRVNNSLTNIQALTSQKALHESFTIHTKDGTAQVLNMTIGGSDDQASISGGSGAVIEDQKTTLSGALSIHDPDAGQDSFIAHQYQGQFGHLDFNKDGTWHYALDNNKLEVQQLGGSERHHDVFTIQSVDGTTHSINIEVSGTNDTPTIHGQSHSLSEDGAMLSGQMHGNDIDNHATLKYSIQKSVAGLTFNSDGSYTFDPSHSAYQHLAQGQSETVTIPVTVTDEHGASATQNLEIVLTGTNDLAKISGVDSGDVHENQAGQDMSPDHAQPGMAVLGQNTLTTSGKLSINDLDNGESVFDTNGGTYSYSGQYGHLQLHRDGSWNYSVAAGTHDWHQGSTPTTVGSTIDKLGVGETLTDTITVRTKDGTTHDIVVTIHGDNDTPYVSSEVQLNSGKEDTIQTLTAADLLANAIDVDHNDQGQLSIANLIADHGSIRDNQDGTYTYTPESNYHGKVHFSYDINDAHGGSTPTGASLDLASVNDASVLAAGQDSGSVTEDHLRAGTTDQLWSGWSNLDVTDVDGTSEAEIAFIEVNGVKHAVPTDFAMNLTANHGYFSTTHSTDGHNKWSYTADNANPDIQGLKSGQQLQDSMVLITKDGTRIPVTATIQGQDDHVIIDTPNALTAAIGTVVEDIKTTVAGMLQAHDLDKGDHVTFELAGSSSSQAGSYGTFYVDRDGHWHYDLDAAKVDSLLSGDGKAETFNIVAISSDGSRATQKVEVLVKGTNDAATITGVDTGDVYESTYADRSPDYQRGNISHLWNDHIHTSGKLDVVDSDAGEAHFDNNAPAYQYFGQYGRLILQPDGNWSYYAEVGDSAVGRKIDALNNGENLTDTITIRSADGTTHDVVITIHGDNDAPFASGEVQLQPGKEDQTQILTQAQLLSNSMDVDSSDAGKLHIDNLHADHGSIRDNQDGTYTFTPEKDYNGQVHFTYDVKDAHGGTTTTGANLALAATPDNAQISYANSDQHQLGVTEDRNYIDTHDNLHFDGKLDIVDPDQGEAKFDINLGSQTYQGIGYDTKLGGHILLMRDGRYTYTIRDHQPLVQNLKQGETITDECVVKSEDGTLFTIKVNIHGTNDAPTLTAQHQSVTEDGAVLSGQMIGQDVDHDATLTYTINHPIDGLTFNSDGSYTFDPSHSSYQQLKNGQTQTITVPVTVTDEHGASTTQNLEVKITGTEDTAQISGTDTGTLTEDRHVQGDAQHTIFTTGVLNIVDADAGEDHFRATHNAHALHDPYGGTLTIGKAGDWAYSVPNGNVQHLGQGETQQVQYEVQSLGGDKHIITLTIHGTNDAPVVSADVQLSAGKEDTTQVITSSDLLSNATDIDNNDIGHLSVTNLAVDHGSILDNGDGTFTLIPEKDYNGPLHFQYQVNDGHGGTAPASASMSVAAVNDRPIVQPITQQLKEDSTNHHVIDLLTGATDKEGDTLSIAQISYSVDGATKTGSLPDGFTLGADGHSLVIDATHSTFQHLAVGQTQQVVVNYLIDDGHGGQTPQTATFTIEGTDDKAVLTSNVIQMSESEALSSKTSIYHGNLQLTDPDTGDHTQFAFSGRYMGQGYAPGSLTIWPDGSYQFRLESAFNRHADDLVDSLLKGESLEFPYQVRTSDGQRLNIIVKVVGEDDQARIEVGQYSTLDNHAYEDNLSPGGTPNQVGVGGNLHVVDPDHGQAGSFTQNLISQRVGISLLKLWWMAIHDRQCKTPTSWGRAKLSKNVQRRNPRWPATPNDNAHSGMAPMMRQ